MSPKTRQSTQRSRGRDSTPKNISTRCPVDDVSSSDEQIAKDTYGPTKCTKTNDLKPMDDVEKVPAAEHSSSSEVPAQPSSSSSPAATTEVSPTSASATPVTPPIVNKGKGHAEGPETVDDSIHAPPNSSSNSSSTLLPPSEDDTDPSLAIPVTSEIFAAAATPTEALLKKFPQKSMLKNEVDSFFGSDPLYKGSSIIGAKDDLCIIIRFYSEDSLKNTIGSAIADLHDIIFHLYDRNADRAAEADRTLLISDIPLDIKPSHLKSCLARFGLVKKLTLRTPPNAIWQKATVIFDNKETVDSFYNIWAIMSGDLHSIWTETKAHSINIPRSQYSYRPKPYAHVTFPSQETLDAAVELSFQFNNRSLTWYHSSDAKDLCPRCGFKHSNEDSNCAKSSHTKRSTDKNVQRLYNKYKPAQHRNDTQKLRASSRSHLPSGFSSAPSSSRKLSHSQCNNREQPYQNPAFQSHQDDYSELPTAEAVSEIRERISEVKTCFNTLVTYIENFELQLARLEKTAGLSDNPIRRVPSQAEKDATTAEFNDEWGISPLTSSELHSTTPHPDEDITMSFVSNNNASQSSSSVIDPVISTSSGPSLSTPVTNLINVSDAELMANPSASLAATVHQMLNPVVDTLKSIKKQQDIIKHQQKSLPSSAPSQDHQ
ncbi:hypothetical protein C1645_882585 [Glomus cerebriforme]|uniref:RRM domain-containing protein n=1 Tax=Glomus cerebriforme TaxID=658196 RepID=A0A397S4I9_9GLOM|nr:hypothetical protein C1645_882585 [Glomus cerebriforme]